MIITEIGPFISMNGRFGSNSSKMSVLRVRICNIFKKGSSCEYLGNIIYIQNKKLRIITSKTHYFLGKILIAGGIADTPASSSVSNPISVLW